MVKQRQSRTTSVIPAELQDVAKTGDVDALEARVEKCYSTEKYEDFQTAVKKISLETIVSEEGTEKIKRHAKEYFKGQVMWAVLIWLITLIGALLLQKFFHVLG